MNCLCEFDRLSLSVSENLDPSLLWWLVLFIEALGLFPNIEWEGRQQRTFQRGTSSTSYPDESWSSTAKSTGDDAVLGSTVTSILPLDLSWSCCNKMDAFA